MIVYHRLSMTELETYFDEYHATLEPLFVDHDPLLYPRSTQCDLRPLCEAPGALAVACARAAAAAGRSTGMLAELSLRIVTELPHIPTRLQCLVDLAEVLLPQQGEIRQNTLAHRLVLAIQNLPTAGGATQAKARQLYRVATRLRQVILPSDASLEHLVRHAVRMACRLHSPQILLRILRRFEGILGHRGVVEALLNYLHVRLFDGLGANNRDAIAQMSEVMLEARPDIPDAPLHDVVLSLVAWFEQVRLQPILAERRKADAKLQALYLQRQGEVDAAWHDTVERLIAGETTLAPFPATLAADPRLEGLGLRVLSLIEAEAFGDLLHIHRHSRLGLDGKPRNHVLAETWDEFANLRRRSRQRAGAIGGAVLQAWHEDSDSLDLDHEARPCPPRLALVAEALANVSEAVLQSHREERLHKQLAHLSDQHAATDIARHLLEPEQLVAYLSLARWAPRLPSVAIDAWMQCLNELVPACSRADASSAATVLAFCEHSLRSTEVPPGLAVRTFATMPGIVRRLLIHAAWRSTRIARALFDGTARQLRTEILHNGGSYSTLADCLIGLLRGLAPADHDYGRRWLQETPAWQPSPGRLAVAAGLLGASKQRPWKVLGRTLVFRTDDGYLACKLRRRGESTALFSEEALKMAWAVSQAGAGRVPAVVGILSDIEVAEAWRQAIAALDIQIGSPTQALVYHTPSSAYFTYVNDIEDGEQRLGALCVGISDLLSWLECGVASAALTVRNHNVSTAGTRKYEWMVDVCSPSRERWGMGRLDRIVRACTYPNLRASGVADFAELTSVYQLWNAAENERDRMNTIFNPVPNLAWFGKTMALCLHEVRIIGDLLLDATLLHADGYRLQGALEGLHCRATEASISVSSQTAAILEALAHELHRLWTHAVASYTRIGRGVVETFLETVVDFPVMARQLVYFLEPRNYAPDLDATLSEVSPPETAVHELILKHDASLLEALEQQWSQHLFARGCNVRIDLSSYPRQWKSPRHADANDAIGFAENGSEQDLGAYNGPWTLLEVERGLYIVAGMMAATHSLENASFASNKS